MSDCGVRELSRSAGLARQHSGGVGLELVHMSEYWRRLVSHRRWTYSQSTTRACSIHERASEGVDVPVDSSRTDRGARRRS